MEITANLNHLQLPLSASPLRHTLVPSPSPLASSTPIQPSLLWFPDGQVLWWDSQGSGAGSEPLKFSEWASFWDWYRNHKNDERYPLPELGTPRDKKIEPLLQCSGDDGGDDSEDEKDDRSLNRVNQSDYPSSEDVAPGSSPTPSMDNLGENDDVEDDGDNVPSSNPVLASSAPENEGFCADDTFTNEDDLYSPAGTNSQPPIAPADDADCNNGDKGYPFVQVGTPGDYRETSSQTPDNQEDEHGHEMVDNDSENGVEFEDEIMESVSKDDKVVPLSTESSVARTEHHWCHTSTVAPSTLKRSFVSSLG
jgi:hypothetical protein